MTPNLREPLEVILDSFWLDKLGISGSLCERGIELVKVDAPINIPSRWSMIAMKRGVFCMIPVETGKVREAREALKGFTVEEVFTGRGLRALLEMYGVAQDRGVHWLHLHCDKGCFKPYREYGARLLTEEDRIICERWTKEYPRAIGPYSYSYADPVPFGVVEDGELSSVAIVLRYNLPLWEIGVETRPDCRGRGYAKSVVSMATKYILERGKIPWYYIDAEPLNVASLHVAKALGFFEYAETLNMKSI